MNFIYTGMLSNLTVCDRLINCHQNSKNQFAGHSYHPQTNVQTVDPLVKDSIDVIINKNDPIEELYVNELYSIIQQYLTEYSYSSWGSSWGLLENITIQYYKPTGGFKNWHCERSSSVYPNSARHLVFMTYLNDVTDQGETEFFYQKLKVKPVKGLTLIWPADWTHTHRGVPSPTQEKYIVTGWLSFLDEPQPHSITF
jgi:hypothetical protein